MCQRPERLIQDNTRMIDHLLKFRGGYPVMCRQMRQLLTHRG
ncbi:MAG: hypothetical protein JWQ49_6064 [Edaphobacter sp.]|nr:hypothetical protein [Edaphobacter sp.]